jgi:hypothetical protein
VFGKPQSKERCGIQDVDLCIYRIKIKGKFTNILLKPCCSLMEKEPDVATANPAPWEALAR